MSFFLFQISAGPEVTPGGYLPRDGTEREQQSGQHDRTHPLPGQQGVHGAHLSHHHIRVPPHVHLLLCQ